MATSFGPDLTAFGKMVHLGQGANYRKYEVFMPGTEDDDVTYDDFDSDSLSYDVYYSEMELNRLAALCFQVKILIMSGFKSLDSLEEPGASISLDKCLPIITEMCEVHLEKRLIAYAAGEDETAKKALRARGKECILETALAAKDVGESLQDMEIWSTDLCEVLKELEELILRKKECIENVIMKKKKSEDILCNRDIKRFVGCCAVFDGYEIEREEEETQQEPLLQELHLRNSKANSSLIANGVELGAADEIEERSTHLCKIHINTGPEDFAVYFSDSEDRREFLFQDLGANKCLRQLARENREFTHEDFRVGQYVVAFHNLYTHTKPQWFRGRILSEQDDEFEVYFVDHGCRENVSINKVWPMPHSVFHLSGSCAIACYLQSNGGKWVAEDGAAMRKLVAKDKDLAVTFHSWKFERECEVWDVSLKYRGANGAWVNVSDELERQATRRKEGRKVFRDVDRC